MGVTQQVPRIGIAYRDAPLDDIIVGADRDDGVALAGESFDDLFTPAPSALGLES